MKTWKKYNIQKQKGVLNLIKVLQQDKPKVIGFDTESTGLSIIKDYAFLLIIGWEDKVFTIELNEETKLLMNDLYNEIKNAVIFYAWNTKYDLHMLRNAGIEYPYNNLSDGMIIARLLLPVDEPSLALKNIASKYTELKDAKEDQKDIKELIRITKHNDTKQLQKDLKEFGYTLGKIDKQLKDPLSGYDNLPNEVKEVYNKWAKEFNHTNLYEVYQPNYKRIYDLYPEVMLKYAANDVIIMFEFWNNYFHIVLKEFKEIFITESQIIIPLYKQELIGFSIDRKYLNDSIINMQNAIKESRETLKKIAGQELSAGQHKVIKDLIESKWNIITPSVDKKTLPTLKKHNIKELNEFVDTLTNLRSFEKWYGTYLIAIKKSANENSGNRINTSYKQADTKTGRLSSNFQQFPREGIKYKGKDLFDPRRLIKPTQKDGYDYILYADYSQIELRVQAQYTIDLFGGDRNLCSAFINFNNEENWKPTDLHGLNAITAFGQDIVNHPNFKKLRGAGKTINFAVNYGSGLNALLVSDQLRDFSSPQIEKMYNAYRVNFPLVKKFQVKIQRDIESKNVSFNYYGRPYRMSNKKFAYKVANYVVQGTAADILKRAILKVDEYITENKLKSRVIANIHDEIQIELHKDELSHAYEIKRIMEDIKYSNTNNIQIPTICDLEITDSYWNEKKDFQLK